MSYKPVGSADGYYISDSIILDLNEVVSIRAYDECIQAVEKGRSTCKHGCEFQLPNRKAAYYRTADQILHLQKLAKDKIHLTSEQRSHFQTQSLKWKHFCVIQ